jgi:hypothetical protein
MQQTIRTCDWCPGVRKPARGNFVLLSNGRNAARLDLCGEHRRELLALFRIRHRKIRVAPKSAKGVTTDKIVAWLQTQKQPQPRRAICAALELRANQASCALVQLMREQRIGAVGATKGRRYVGNP